VLQDRKPPNQGDVKKKLHPAVVRYLSIYTILQILHVKD